MVTRALTRRVDVPHAGPPAETVGQAVGGAR
jgi:hypothetical protein